MFSPTHRLSLCLVVAALALLTDAARQPFDVHKIIDAFRYPRQDLIILCAHRGLRWNGTAENSRDSYFRATEAGLECIETDIHLSADGQLPMIHDAGLGRSTDAGEQTGAAAYNPYTGQGANPPVAASNFTGFLDGLHLRDEAGAVRRETVPTLPDMVRSIRDAGANVVLQLDFKDEAAVAPAYWQLRNLTNAAGVPANEWCVYKLQARWYKTRDEFEALPWVRDAFASGVRLAFLPVYNPRDEDEWDTLGSLQQFLGTNYTISAEIEKYGTGGKLQRLQTYMQNEALAGGGTFKTTGIFWAAGDLVDFATTKHFDMANFSTITRKDFVFQEGSPPVQYDILNGEYSPDGHDHRTDFNWILNEGFNWVICDTPDLWADRLAQAGKRNLAYLLADGEELVVEPTYYKERRHAKDFS